MHTVAHGSIKFQMSLLFCLLYVPVFGGSLADCHMNVMLTHCLVIVKRFVCVGLICGSRIENIKTTLEPII